MNISKTTQNVSIAIITSLANALIFPSPYSNSKGEDALYYCFVDTVGWLIIGGIIALLVIFIKNIFKKYRRNWPVIFRDTVVILSLLSIINLIGDSLLIPDLEERYMQK